MIYIIHISSLFCWWIRGIK